MLSAEEAGALWERLDRSACCYARSPRDEHQWMRCSTRSARATRRRWRGSPTRCSRRPSDLPTGHRQYLLTAGMTGYLAQGKRARGGAAVEPLSDRTPTGSKDIGLRLLHAHAFDLR